MSGVSGSNVNVSFRSGVHKNYRYASFIIKHHFIRVTCKWHNYA